MYNTIGREKIKARRVQKLSAIVTSDHGDFVLKLCVNHGAKMFDGRANLCFILQKLSPSSSSKVVNNG